MAVFVVVNYFGIRWFARINNALVGWKIFIILLVIAAFLVSAFHGENFTSHGFKPEGGWHGVFTAIATSGIVFLPRLPPGNRARGRDRQPAPQRADRGRGIGGAHRPDLHALQVAFIRALPERDQRLGRLGAAELRERLRPAGRGGDPAGHELARGAALHRRHRVARRHGSDLHHGDLPISYAMARNGNRAPGAGADDRPGRVPLVPLLVTFVVGLVVFLPFLSWQQLVGFITSATVLSFASGPLVHAALRKQLPDAGSARSRVPGGTWIPFLAFWASNPHRLLVRAGTSSGSSRSRWRSASSCSRSTTCSARTPEARPAVGRQLGRAVVGRARGHLLGRELPRAGGGQPNVLGFGTAIPRAVRLLRPHLRAVALRFPSPDPRSRRTSSADAGVGGGGADAVAIDLSLDPG